MDASYEFLDMCVCSIEVWKLVNSHGSRTQGRGENTAIQGEKRNNGTGRVKRQGGELKGKGEERVVGGLINIKKVIWKPTTIEAS